jgi:hypothetical protein
VIKDKSGNRTYRAYQRYPWSVWNNLEMCNSLLAPGPEGAVATAHFEQFREGVQHCEARVFIEQALADKLLRQKLGEELAKRCQAELDDRILSVLRGSSSYPTGGRLEFWEYGRSGEAGHAWFQSSGWRERNARLFALAGEVAAKLGP